jgi:hypothetical protein
MPYDLAKRNRLNGKFNFKMRDWRVELDEINQDLRIPMKNGRPGKGKSDKNKYEGEAMQRQ